MDKMLAPHQERIVREYLDLSDRYKKLHKTLNKIEAGKFSPKDNREINIMYRQEKAMLGYLNALEIRAEIEGVDLDEWV